MDSNAARDPPSLILTHPGIRQEVQWVLRGPGHPLVRPGRCAEHRFCHAEVALAQCGLLRMLCWLRPRCACRRASLCRCAALPEARLRAAPGQRCARCARCALLQVRQAVPSGSQRGHQRQAAAGLPGAIVGAHKVQNGGHGQQPAHQEGLVLWQARQTPGNSSVCELRYGWCSTWCCMGGNLWLCMFSPKKELGTGWDQSQQSAVGLSPTISPPLRPTHPPTHHCQPVRLSFRPTSHPSH